MDLEYISEVLPLTILISLRNFKIHTNLLPRSAFHLITSSLYPNFTSSEYWRYSFYWIVLQNSSNLLKELVGYEAKELSSKLKES